MEKRKILVIFILVFSILLSSFSFYGYQVMFSPNFLVDRENRILQIEKGETFKSLLDKIRDGDYVKDLISFSFLAKVMGYDETIKPGRYMIKSNMTNIDVIHLLRSGVQMPVRVTFNNIRLKKDLAEKLTANLGMSTQEFDSALNDFVNSSKEFNNENVIGMFIPNTYEVYYNISGKELMQRMHKEFNNFWNEERTALADSLHLTPVEVITLASIVNAESVKKDEAKIIAGLYINRLKRNIALQADPTLVFASGDFGLKRVLNVHKEIDSPYNTYKYTGLPPGPINMPPIYAVDAVLHYAKHNYIYMCAREDFSGYHNFADNIRDHINNANKYQRQLSIEQRKARQNGN